ncbi:MAG: conserved rane protein of unknown function [Panacagrimonas sp.]|jgi:hypothetical protein|nr:hypothetical protein [Panacagrimonas sp.]MCC2656881.1 conserved rane protein of unknown function [Panacagrimonas sp.]
MIVQVISLVSACIVLFAFFRQQQGAWQATDVAYLACNFVGTAVLTVVAWIGAQWGFVLVEAVWAGVSFRGLLRALRRGPA